MKYTKKAVTIEAIQFDGTWNSLVEIAGKFPELVQDGMFLEEDKVTVPWFGIKTLEGTMKCTPSDYVIKGIKGEFYPCKADIFEASYNSAANTKQKLDIVYDIFISHSSGELVKSVNAAIKDGWVCIGGIAIVMDKKDAAYAQAMIKGQNPERSVATDVQ